MKWVMTRENVVMMRVESQGEQEVAPTLIPNHFGHSRSHHEALL